MNWTVLLSVNEAWLDFYINWLVHAAQLKLSSPQPALQVIAMDATSLAELGQLSGMATLCSFRSVRVIRGFEPDRAHEDASRGRSGPLTYATPPFNAMMHKRLHFVSQLLRAMPMDDRNGLLFVDVDSVWRRDPRPFLQPTHDVLSQNDASWVDRWLSLMPRRPCGGFMAYFKTAHTIALMDRWLEAAKKSDGRMGDQGLLWEVLTSHDRPAGLRVGMLPIGAFPNGNAYFDVFSHSERARAVVVHANDMIGADAKRSSLRHHGLWKLPKACAAIQDAHLENSSLVRCVSSLFRASCPA